MSLTRIVQISKAYARLGTAIQEQLDHVLAGDMTADNINEAALAYIEVWLRDAARMSEAINWEVNSVLDYIAEFRDEMSALYDEEDR